MTMVHGHVRAISRRDALAGGLATGGLLLAERTAQAQAAKPKEIKIGIATYLSGAASVFGVPARDTADMLIEGINSVGGIGGLKVRPIYVDEGPGVDHVAGEYRRLVQSEDVSLILSGVSSADCIACAPLAEELRRPTLLWDCGTQRIFEDGSYSYPSRPQGNAISEMLATALYLVKAKPNFRTIAVVNQGLRLGPRLVGGVQGRHVGLQARNEGRSRAVPAFRRHRLRDGDHAPAGPAPGGDPVDVLGRRPRHLPASGERSQAVRPQPVRAAPRRILAGAPG